MNESYRACRNCGHMNPGAVSRCVHCGRSRRSWPGWVAALVLLGALGAFMTRDERPEPAITHVSPSAPPGPSGSATAQTPSEPVRTTSSAAEASRDETGAPIRYEQSLPRPRGPATDRGAAALPARSRDACLDHRTAERLDEIARLVARKTMSGARRVQGQRLSCTHDPRRDLTRVDLHVAWEDSGFESYAVGGVVHLGPDDFRWEPGPGNAALRRYQKETADATRNLVLGGLALAAIAAAIGPADEEPADSRPAPRRPPAGQACLTNRSPSTVDLERRWQGETRWVSYSVAPDQPLRLVSRESDTLYVRMDVDPRGPQFAPRTFGIPLHRSDSGAICDERARHEIRLLDGRLTIEPAAR